MMTLFPMAYQPYQPPIKAEEIPAAKRAISEMVALSGASYKSNPTKYNRIVADYWKARQAAIASY